MVYYNPWDGQYLPDGFDTGVENEYRQKKLNSR